MIDGVKVKQLKVIPDDRGKLMEILRNDDKIFQKFGQVYMTTVKPNTVKAWHYHKKQTDNFACIKGKVRLALFDNRENSETKGVVEEFTLSLENPLLIQIPPKVMHGFECIGNEEAVVINTVTETYNKDNPDEFRIDPFNNDIPFKWNATKGK